MSLLRPLCQGLLAGHQASRATLCSNVRLAIPPRPRFAFPRQCRNIATESRSPPKPQFRTRNEVYAAKNKALLMYTSAVILVAVGASYAAVPLYRMFCAATGFAGTPKVGTGRFEPERLVPVEGAHRIKVHFNADKSEQLPWKFTPQQKFVSVLPGETSLAFYTAKNNSDKDIIGIATYNVTPDRIAPYFSKVECFCFEEQRLLAGEEVDMPLLFFIDKDMLEDPSCKHVEDVVLSYTFFRARRNAHGQLEPDAEEDVVQNSLGFGGFENAPKAEIRNTNASSSTQSPNEKNEK
ncbi:Cytochrome c oxidase assembly protein COX11, mitochondrial [Hypsizygus marmoreus]|uniref:Cytochrome c oxidase assembly protein COX11, mitochondrial n=1 Tax=Hypsizygus marmoreus TaxID=39966 RepID=A0A369K3S4_HYPMA|nr:Cytochrome c oxidase assembly protein COX11, mitochondrial [Hypsizygus marmoreus]